MRLLDIFFPPMCCGCGWLGSFACEPCEKRLHGDVAPVMRMFRVAWGATDFAVCSAFSPSDALREIIHVLKYSGCMEVVPVLRRIVFANLERDFFRCDIGANDESLGCSGGEGGRPVFVPVPLHARRQRERGFNQSEIIGRMFAEFFGGELRLILERGRWTEPQVSLEKEARWRNVHEAFSLRKDVLNSTNLVPDSGYAADLTGPRGRFFERPIVLVDDVFTTGATLLACARVLKDAGFSDVSALVLTHGI